MTDPEDLQLARTFTEAFNARDLDAMLAVASPECVLVAIRSELEGDFVGHAGLKRWAADYFDAIPDAHITVEELRAIDDNRMLLLGRQSGSAGTGGVPFDAPLAAVVTVHAGKLEHVVLYRTHAEAVAAAEVPNE